MAISATLWNADRSMVEAGLVGSGVKVRFADGFEGTVPISKLPDVIGRDVTALELSNPYVLRIITRSGETEVPADFIRYHSDPKYRSTADEGDERSMQAFGGRLQRLREKAGLTQEALSKQCGISRGTLARIETGRYFPRFQTLERLADGLQVRFEDLMIAPEKA